MLAWDQEAVAQMLGTRAELEDNSSFRFAFNLHGNSALLCVFPLTGDVQLIVGNKEQPWAIWQLHYSAITFNDEIPEEGGQCLIFKPIGSVGRGARPSHWIVLGRCENNFEILTVFLESSVQPER
jgi:hypothetical protein